MNNAIINHGFSKTDLNYWLQLARADFKQYRNNLLRRWSSLRHNYILDEFLYFTHQEKIWDETWIGPPYITTEDVFRYLQEREENTEIWETVMIVRTYSNKTMPEIKQHLEYMKEEVKSMNSWPVSISPPPSQNPHFAVCEFLTESDIPSTREFARNFKISWFDHWDEALKTWALAEIYWKVFPENYLAWCVGRAITNKDYKFLAYLLVKTHGEGDEAICKLEDGYKSFNSTSLEIDIGAWKEMFDKPKIRGYMGGWLQRVYDTKDGTPIRFILS